MTDLTLAHCVPCEGNEDPLTLERENELHTAVPEWQLSREGVHTLHREYTLKHFSEAVECVNEIAKLAESEGHHPDLQLHSYKKLNIRLTTHAIKGLSENDFIMAAKIDQLMNNRLE